MLVPVHQKDGDHSGSLRRDKSSPPQQSTAAMNNPNPERPAGDGCMEQMRMVAAKESKMTPRVFSALHSRANGQDRRSGASSGDVTFDIWIAPYEIEKPLATQMAADLS